MGSFRVLILMKHFICEIKAKPYFYTSPNPPCRDRTWRAQMHSTCISLKPTEMVDFPPACVTSMTKSMEATRGMFSEFRHTIVRHFTAGRISRAFYVFNQLKGEFFYTSNTEFRKRKLPLCLMNVDIFIIHNHQVLQCKNNNKIISNDHAFQKVYNNIFNNVCSKQSVLTTEIFLTKNKLIWRRNMNKKIE
jgi:hypothetical protein